MLLVVAVGIASRWSFRPLARRSGGSGCGASPSAIGLLVATLITYYIAAGLFATYVLQAEAGGHRRRPRRGQSRAS